jgi:hypothetical protein
MRRQKIRETSERAAEKEIKNSLFSARIASAFFFKDKVFLRTKN